MMRINIKECADILSNQDNILIITHAHPDGDTLGSGFALCRALLKLGKKARVICADEIQTKYLNAIGELEMPEFKEDFVVAVDVATINLLGDIAESYGDKIDLCIDHHNSNTGYAKYTLLDGTAAAACETVMEVIKALGVSIDKDIANCLFTGISTDTGCFRYASTSAATFKAASELVELGAENGKINRIMFETKTKTYAAIERLALEGMQFFLNDRVCVITVTQDMYKQTGSQESETEALPSLTRQIEGVEVGLTIREKTNGECKCSIRTFERVDASKLAAFFGGGGHSQASACRFECSVEEAKKLLVEKCEELLG